MKTQAFPMVKRILPLVTLLAMATPAYAIWPFGKSEEEIQAEAADHVAKLLRKPKQTIAKAQIAIEDDDLEGAIKLYREAIAQFEEIERAEDTSGAVFSDLRFKKFHCISMLDALILKRSEVMDVRQAISDTTELEARLAQEREALKKEEEKQANRTTKPQRAEALPDAHSELLSEEEKSLATAASEVERLKHRKILAESEYKDNKAAFDELAKIHTEADSKAFLAQRHYQQIEKHDDATERDIEHAKEAYLSAKETAQEIKAELEKIRTHLTTLEGTLEEVEIASIDANENLKKAQARVAMRKQILEKQEEQNRIAEQKRQAELQKSQEAQRLLQKQREAEEHARLAQAREAERLKKDAAAREKAEKDRQRLIIEKDLCTDLWNDKDIYELERRLMKNCEQWPNEHLFLVMLARIRLLQNRLDDTLDIVELIPATGETGLQARLVAAGAYLKKNQPEEAKKILEQAMKDAPDAPEPYFNMAITFLRMPKFDPDRDIAAQYYIRSVELGGKRSLLLERRLNMKEAPKK
ncbi:MAG: hypothetical protein Q4F99_01400 [bacterium]|nr:hypothetical protein [bacterium]